MKVALCALGIVCAVVFAFLLGTAVTVIPKDVLTQNRMDIMGRDVRQYVKRTGRLPESVADLSRAMRKEGDKDYGRDGWGAPLQYCASNKTATIWSEGKSVAPVRCLYSLRIEVE